MAIVEIAVASIVLAACVKELGTELRAHGRLVHAKFGWFDLAAGGLLIFECLSSRPFLVQSINLDASAISLWCIDNRLCTYGGYCGARPRSLAQWRAILSDCTDVVSPFSRKWRELGTVPDEEEILERHTSHSSYTYQNQRPRAGRRVRKPVPVQPPPQTVNFSP